MRILHAAPLFAALCVGCAPPVNRAQSYASAEEARANYTMAIKDRCATYGFTPGTTDFSNCMMQVDANAQAAQQANIQQQRAAILGILANQPAATMPQATFTPMQTRPTINTNCQTLPSGYVSCASR